MKLKKFLSFYQSSILMIVCILFAVLGLVFGVRPLLSATTDLYGHMRQQQKDIAALKSKISVLATLDENTLRDNLGILTSAVPADKSIVTILSTLENTATQSIVSFDSFQLQKPGGIATDSAKRQSAEEVRLGVSFLPFNASVSGPADAVERFLTIISPVRRLVRMRTFTVTYKGSTIHASAELEGFYSPLPSAIGAVLTPITGLSEKDLETVNAVSALPLAYTVAAPAVAGPVVTGGKSDPFAP